MNNWDKLRIMINSNSSDHPTRVSQTKSLLEIIEVAENWNIDPGKMENPKLSNIYEIIFEAKIAINLRDKSRLNELFRLASEKTNRDLRLDLRGSKREVIKVIKIFNNTIPIYQFELNKEQYDRIIKETEHYFNFVE